MPDQSARKNTRKNMELLYLKSETRWIGIDLEEISKVSTDPALLNMLAEQTTDAENYLYYPLATMFKKPAQQADNLVYLITPELKRQLILGITGQVEIITVPLDRILPQPRYLRTRQKPYLTWGFVKQEEQLVMLLSFTRFTEECIQDGQ